jgi:hypothetical protein
VGNCRVEDVVGPLALADVSLKLAKAKTRIYSAVDRLEIVSVRHLGEWFGFGTKT